MSVTTVTRRTVQLPQQRNEPTRSQQVFDQIEQCWAQHGQERARASLEAARTMHMIADGTLEMPTDDVVNDFDVADLLSLPTDSHTRQTLSQRTREALISFCMRFSNAQKSRGLRPCPLKKRGDMPKKLSITRAHQAGALRKAARASLEDQIIELGEGVVKTEGKLLAAI